MKLAAVLGIGAALLLHAAFLLFGGLLLPEARADLGTTREVELVGDVEQEKPQEKPQEPEEVEPEELKPPEELPPDAEEIASPELSTPNDDGPALEAASLAAISAALEGGGGGAGEFAESLSFSSGGRIGNTGRELGADPIENAFSLADIDQKPRAILQTQALYPASLRSKKLEGVVTVIFVVDAAGKVIQPRIEKSAHPAFEGPAMDAVKQWKFEAAVKGGQRVPCKMRVQIRFKPS